jgi:hypothetical protein
MKKYFLTAGALLLLCSCQHYFNGAATPTPAFNGKWTFEKDTITVTNGTTIVHQYINNIGAGSILQFGTGQAYGTVTGVEYGNVNYVATPDTSLNFTYTTSGNGLTITYPPQIVDGVTRSEETFSYTIVQSTAHLLELNYVYVFTDSEGTGGEVYANYYWTR